MLSVMTEATPELDTEATCKRCRHTKARTEFYRDTYTPSRVRQPCKECHRKNRRSDYANKQGVDVSYAQVLKSKYGITLDEYNQMVRAQGNRCGVCKRPESAKGRDGKVRRLAVDHDHATGSVRGLLCMRCNLVVWALEDNHTTLPAIDAYLHHHRQVFTEGGS